MKEQSLTICVCGAGTMGTGIAQVFASEGYDTLLFDLNGTALEKAKEKILSKAPHARIRFSTDIEECKAGLIIEAIIETEEAKLSLFNSLAAINDASAIFATNTSSLSVSSIASKTPVANRLIGLHFFNPAPVMQLVEVVVTNQSEAAVAARATELVRSVGKTPVICRDAPGFIVNHVARPYYLEALYLVEKGTADHKTIDALMEATGFKMGPFKLMDLIGNDINYSVSSIVYDALGKPRRLQPSPIQFEMVQKNLLGRKTGKGYYEYPAR